MSKRTKKTKKVGTTVRCTGFTIMGKRCKRFTNNGKACSSHRILIKPYSCIVDSDQEESDEEDRYNHVGPKFNYLTEEQGQTIFAILENLNRLKPILKKHFKIKSPVVEYGLNDAEVDADGDETGQLESMNLITDSVMKKVEYPLVDGSVRVCDFGVLIISDSVEDSCSNLTLVDNHEVQKEYVELVKHIKDLIIPVNKTTKK